MSHAAIAAVLARDDLSAGERLVALSLASFANREQLAWPGISAGAARAGLSRSRYLQAREQLTRRGLLAVEDRGCGRGHATAVRLLFAQSGPWCDAEINAQLLEAVLAHSRARGPARLLLAALAALADPAGVVEGLRTDELCRAAGLANSTYRRARASLLASGEITVSDDSGGRGRTSRWQIMAPALDLDGSAIPARRRPPPPGARPLLASVRADDSAINRVEAHHQESAEVRFVTEKGPILSGVSPRKGPNLSGVSARKGPNLSGVSAANGPIPSGVSRENPAKTPPETPPPNARAGKETPEP